MSAAIIVLGAAGAIFLICGYATYSRSHSYEYSRYRQYEKPSQAVLYSMLGAGLATACIIMLLIDIAINLASRI